MPPHLPVYEKNERNRLRISIDQHPRASSFTAGGHVNLDALPSLSARENFLASYLNHGAGAGVAIRSDTKGECIKFRNYRKTPVSERRTNDPPGCPDSSRTTTLCSRERSWHEQRFRASVSRAARRQGGG